MSPAVRLWSRARREATAIREAVRTAPRRTVVTESVLAGLVLLCSLAPVPLVPPAHPVSVALLGVWAALLVPARRMYPTLTVLCCVPLIAGDNVWAMVVVPCVVWSAVRRITPHGAPGQWSGRALPVPCSCRLPPNPSADSRRCRTWPSAPAWPRCSSCCPHCPA
ncbi:hypothetical protein ACFQ2Y_01425 [Streptomyces malaysiensis subsp. malaysiensis]